MLQSIDQWRRRLGYLQRPVRLAELGNLWLCDLIQPLLGFSHPRLPCHAVQREEGSLAFDEGQARFTGRQGER